MNLALADIRKNKSATVSLFIFIVIAALLLNIGLTVITQINTFIDSKAEQLDDPHVIFVMNEENYHSTYHDFLSDYPGIKETETENIINMNVAKFQYGDSELTSSAVIFNADAHRNIAPLKLIENLPSASGNDIYIPYSFKVNGDYELGDEFVITYQNKEYVYRIAGFLETTMMGTNEVGVMKFMLPENTYHALVDQLHNDSKGLIISILMEDQIQSPKLKNDFLENVKNSQVEETSGLWGLDIEIVKTVNTLTIDIIAVILIIFAAIIVLVSLIVIKYRVSNSIEDGLINIGVLKALGYTNGQIISSIILQFILVSFSASIVGIALSYGLMNIIGSIISTLSGLLWDQHFDIVINLVNIVIVTFCIVFVTYISAFRIRKIQPIIALRGGIQTHSFRKNHVPLENTVGGVHFLLAIKSMLSNLKQNIMILLIMVALTFVSVFSVVLYYNIAVDKTAFINLFSEEPANLLISVEPTVNIEELSNDIQQMDEVRKVNILGRTLTNIDGQAVYTNVTDYYNRLENDTVYEGRQPKFENEISISWVVSKQINKGVGDTVEVEYGNKTAQLLVTGLSQTLGNLGQTAALTTDGIQQLRPDYNNTTLYVYLDGIPNKSFIEDMKEQHGDLIVEILDLDENKESKTGIYTDAVFAVMVIILTITVLVVVVILYLVIKTMIIKRKKEFGIMKAIGYSTVQLIHQITLSFIPVIVIGVVIGGVLSYFFTNPMLSVLLSSTGVKRLDFTVHLPTTIMLCVCILILAYFVSIFVSLKIRKISAYSLIRE